MMDLVRCVLCEAPVRLPEALPEDVVRCPHCGESYALKEILSGLPPKMEVIRDTKTKAPSPVTPDPIVTHSPVQEVAPIVVDNTPDGGREPDPRVLIPSPMKMEALRRKPMSQRVIVSFVKVALGGVAGLFIGQLILWWLPQPYRTDPLDLAPRLPEQVAFLAPLSLRGEPLFLEEDPLDDLRNEPLQLDDLKNLTPSGGQSATGKPDASTSPPNQDAIPAPPPGTSGRSDVAEGAAGMPDAPKIGIQELRTSLAAAREGLEKEAEDPDKLFQLMGELAHNITFADMSEPSIAEFAEDAHAFLQVFSSDATRLDRFAAHASDQLAESKAVDRTGTIITGKVTAISSVGKLFQSEVELLGTKEPVSVISLVDPAEKKAYQVRDRVLVLGVIVNDPGLYFDYEGDMDVVVVGGLPLKL